MKVYVLYYENESGDRFLNGVLGYMPTLEEMIERFRDCGDVEEMGSKEEEDTTYGPPSLKNNRFTWQYMTVDIKEYEIESSEKAINVLNKLRG